MSSAASYVTGRAAMPIASPCMDGPKDRGIYAVEMPEITAEVVYSNKLSSSCWLMIVECPSSPLASQANVAFD